MISHVPLTDAEQRQRSLDTHRRLRGKLSICAKESLSGPADLAVLYTPGVAAPCREIEAVPESVWELTGKGSTVAIVSDGTAVLGLGDIGPLAGLPVMEGKALLFKEFAGINAVPLVLNTKDPDEIIRIVEALAPSFGGINLEDISAPRCFEIERRLQEKLDIPVFHDDQHGTAVVVLAALTTAVSRVKKSLTTIRVVINGAGAAGTAIAELLLEAKVSDLVVCDLHGILLAGDPKLSPSMAKLASKTNPRRVSGSLAEALAKADVFIGVSSPNVLQPAHVTSMAPRAIVFALANPEPEIVPNLALSAGAEIAATGRSDHPHQINNVLAFPGIFLGALTVRARQISLSMKLAAAHAIAQLANSDPDHPEYLVPSPFHRELAFQVGLAVASSALDENLAALRVDRETLIRSLQHHLVEAGAHQALKTRHWNTRSPESIRRVQERIGEGLFRLGLISQDQLDAVLAEQSHGDHRLFGEIAMAKKFVDFDTLIDYFRRPGGTL